MLTKFLVLWALFFNTFFYSTYNQKEHAQNAPNLNNHTFKVTNGTAYVFNNTASAAMDFDSRTHTLATINGNQYQLFDENGTLLVEGFIPLNTYCPKIISIGNSIVGFTTNFSGHQPSQLFKIKRFRPDNYEITNFEPGLVNNIIHAGHRTFVLTADALYDVNTLETFLPTNDIGRLTTVAFDGSNIWLGGTQGFSILGQHSSFVRQSLNTVYAIKVTGNKVVISFEAAIAVYNTNSFEREAYIPVNEPWYYYLGAFLTDEQNLVIPYLDHINNIPVYGEIIGLVR